MNRAAILFFLMLALTSCVIAESGAGTDRTQEIINDTDYTCLIEWREEFVDAINKQTVVPGDSFSQRGVFGEKYWSEDGRYLALMSKEITISFITSDSKVTLVFSHLREEDGRWPDNFWCSLPKYKQKTESYDRREGLTFIQEEFHLSDVIELAEPLSQTE